MSEIEYYDESTLPRAKGGLITAAIGATLAMLPMTIFLLSMVSNQTFHNCEAVNTVGFFTWSGMLIWAIGLSCTRRPLRSQDCEGGAKMACSTLYAAFGIFFIFGLIALDHRDFLYDVNAGKGVGIIVVLFFFALQLLLAIGTSKIGRATAGLRLGGTMYYLIAGGFAFLVILNYVSMKSYSSTPQDISKFLLVAMCICAIIAVVCWWCAASKGIAVYPATELEVTQTTETQSTEQPSAYASTPAPATTSSIAPAPAKLDDALLEKLYAMSDEQLQDIVSMPLLYANKAYVDEAENILKKRRAWEAIKEKSDADLMAIVLDESEMFTYTVRDAASMELYSRQSPLLAQAFDNETIETLQQIVASPDDYFDGYVSMAKDILIQRQQQ
jgi:hypothetical protein